MFRTSCIFLLLPTLFSCSRIDRMKTGLDYMSFRISGGTLFTEPTLVTTKEIHFDTGNLLGREVILEGKIASLGKYDTHLVVSDESGRMLVVLTHIDEASSLLQNKSSEHLRVLGTVERGKRVYPMYLPVQ